LLWSYKLCFHLFSRTRDFVAAASGGRKWNQDAPESATTYQTTVVRKFRG
jgi:hypothetical protein